jgi:hypothetical protein
MRKELIIILALALVVGFCWGASAQIVPENHYLVYQLANQYPVDISLTLFDQFDEHFGEFSTNNLVLDKFANPVGKNNEPIFNELIHQTWWQINDPQGVKEVGFLNQFGHQTWDVGDGRYLVLPALKDQPGDIPLWNHYKCYDAVGPSLDIEVLLHDQWGGFGSWAVDPVLFCNPCIKELANGERFEIVTPVAHLAVYRLEPTLLGNVPATAYDQFGMWPITAVEAIWLVLPTEKLTVVENETRAWGSIKSLYR